MKCAKFQFSAFAIFLLILCISFLLQTIQTQLAEKKFFFMGYLSRVKHALMIIPGIKIQGH